MIYLGVALAAVFSPVRPYGCVKIGGRHVNRKTVKITAIVIAAIFFIGICSGIAAMFIL